MILNSSSRTQKGREATLYAINIHTGFEVFTREFPRENSEQYVIPFVLPIRNYVKEKGDKPLLVYIKKETKFQTAETNNELLSLNPITGEKDWGYNIKDSQKGKPFVWIIQGEDGNEFLLHRNPIHSQTPMQ